MNFVAFDGSDERGDGLVRLDGARARHVVSVLRAGVGDAIRLCRVGGLLYREAAIRAVSGAEVLVEPGAASAPPPRLPVDLMLALPRPKCMKRLWPQIAALGVGRVFVTAAEKVEKSYWGCTWLREKEREALMREGLEQAGDSVLPEVSLVRRLRPFVEDAVPALYPPEKRFFAHPSPDAGAGAERYLSSVSSGSSAGATLLAIGPEGGWSAFEVGLLSRNGFSAVSLGPRVLRTDTAVVALAALALHRAAAAGAGAPAV